MTKLRGKFLIDLVLSAMLVFEMLYQFTGNTRHEIVGMAFFVTIVVHLLLSKPWMKTTAVKLRGGKKLKDMHSFQLVLVIALAIFMVALIVSSIAISQMLTSLTGFMLTGLAYHIFVIIHSISSYGLCAVTAVHIAVHWASALCALRITYNPSRRRAINTGVSAAALVGAAVIGAVGIDALSRQVGYAASAARASSATADESSVGDASSMPDANTSDTQDSSDVTTKTHDKKSKQGFKSSTDSGSNSEGDSSTEGSASSSSGTMSGICTLCEKRCPLSDPKCKKPYQAGLI